MKKKLFTLLLFLAPIACMAAHTPESAFRSLLDGNERFANGNLLHPNRSKEARTETTTGQKPFAIILGCSDSRVSPEILFDQGIGDLFIVRVAGNVIGPLEQDSIDYGSLVLGASVIMVLGHQNCGAVDAVLHHNTQDIQAIAALIEPAISDEGKELTLEKAIKANIRNVTEQLKKNPLIQKLIQDNRITVMGGYYNLDSGKVEVLE